MGLSYDYGNSCHCGEEVACGGLCKAHWHERQGVTITLCLHCRASIRRTVTYCAACQEDLAVISAAKNRIVNRKRKRRQ